MNFKKHQQAWETGECVSSGKIIPKVNELSATETAVNKSRMVSYPDVKERGNRAGEQHPTAPGAKTWKSKGFV